jgi:hypothetical protein
MSDSASGSTINIKTEIVRLVENQEEKAELLSYFTKHNNQQGEALLDLNCFDTNKSKLVYLRNFLKPGTFFLSKCGLAFSFFFFFLSLSYSPIIPNT